MEPTDKSNLVDFLCRRIKNKSLYWFVGSESIVIEGNTDRWPFKFNFFIDLSKIKEIKTIEFFKGNLLIHFTNAGIQEGKKQIAEMLLKNINHKNKKMPKPTLNSPCSLYTRQEYLPQYLGIFKSRGREYKVLNSGEIIRIGKKNKLTI